MMNATTIVRFVQATVYTSLSGFGIVGNSMILMMIWRVWRDPTNKESKNHAYVFIFCLSLTDLIFLLSSLLLIVYIFLADWVFGLFLCKVYWIAESLNKCMSAYLLVFLSIDRYYSIVRPTTTHLLAYRRQLALFLSTTMAIVICTNIPFYVYANVTYLEHRNVHMCAHVFPNLHNNTTLYPPWNNSQSYFVLPWATLYFLFPATLILTYYAMLIRSLRRSSYGRRTITKRTKVFRSVLFVVLFYFSCWGPYYVYQLVLLFKSQSPDSSASNVLQLIIAALIYGLPFINSGFNPCLYGLLNKKLRKSHTLARARTRRLRRMSVPPDAFDHTLPRRESIFQMKRFSLRPSIKMNYSRRQSAAPSINLELRRLSRAMPRVMLKPYAMDYTDMLNEKRVLARQRSGTMDGTATITEGDEQEESSTVRSSELQSPTEGSVIFV